MANCSSTALRTSDVSSKPYIVQTVAFPVAGSAENVSPFLKNTTTDEAHLYGPETAQIPPVLPLALTLVAVALSLILVSPSSRLKVTFLQY
jgi:hypothetical protein